VSSSVPDRLRTPNDFRTRVSSCQEDIASEQRTWYVSSSPCLGTLLRRPMLAIPMPRRYRRHIYNVSDSR
jgi:hypothetical protein